MSNKEENLEFSFFNSYNFEVEVKERMQTKTKKKWKLKKSVIFKSISLLAILFSIYFFIQFIRLGILPLKYLFLLFIFIGLADVGLFFLMSKKNYKKRLCGTILSLICIIIYAICIHYQGATINFLKNISVLNIETEHYKIIVKKDSFYKELKDLENHKISYVNDREGVTKVLKKLEEIGKFTTNIQNDNSALINALKEKSVDAILMEEEEYKIYTEMSNEFKEEVKVIDTIEITVEKKEIEKEVAITKEPFSVYITGIDTYGGLTKVSRSDVNIVITVNPVSHKILLTSIPRDYYVQIDGTTGLKDKLTHAGLKGVETSIKTIEKLLETDINYYIRINFTSLVNIVDAIDGVDVDNPFEFTADYEEEQGSVYYVYKKGINHLNGKQALAYVRERYGLREGDVARARHQQQVINGMIKKLTSPTVLTKYTKILNSIEGNFATNLSLDSITKFIQKQLAENPSWTVENNVLSGTDARELTNAFPDLYSAVMIPNEESVKKAIEKINEIKGEN